MDGYALGPLLSVFSSVQTIFHCNKLSYERLVRNEHEQPYVLVWPVATYMYGCESWTPGKNEETRLDRMREDRDKRRKYVHGVANPRIEGN